MQGRFQAGLASLVSQFQKVSFVPKLLCGLFLLLYLLGFIGGVENNLIVTPGYLVPPYVKLWTPLTAVFYEKSILLVFTDIASFVGFSVILEPLWGLKEFLLFSVITGALSMIVTASICLAIYTVSGSLLILFAHIHGFIGLVCGYLVALKQAHPDSVAFPPPAPPTLRIMHLPLLVTIVALILGICKVVSITYGLLAFNGMMVSWVYLRFYQRKDMGTRGDLSETFAFATFFPEFLHPVISVLSDKLFQLLVRIKICPKVVKTYDVGAPSSIKISLPGTTPIDAERRKQKALKALDERLSKTGQPSQINWPSLEDNTSGDEPLSSLHSSLPQPTRPQHLSSSPVESNSVGVEDNGGSLVSNEISN